MATIALLKTMEETRLLEELSDVAAKLTDADGEVVLDFSSVRRISPAALQALETLATKSEERKAEVVLRGINVNIYKVLKLARLSSRFTFTA
jgi:anti-anti-sigma regulatory factor